MQTSRNGLLNRKTEIKISKILILIISSYAFLSFLAPALIDEGEVPELSGRANAFDYAYESSWGNLDHGEYAEIGHDQSKHGGTFAWMELNPIFALTYAIGDLNCHQKHERSWKINDNQMPICVRDVGILFGIILGALIFMLKGVNRWTLRDTFLTIIPDKYLDEVYVRDKRIFVMIGIIFASIIPIGIDGLVQLLTNYESNNSIRLITGIIAGFTLGWLICSMIAAKPSSFDSSEDVILPAKSTLRIR
ncbi:MAG: putative membrane protein [Candidatus Thalassarchaeaceae archaeon]|jgi:uncharacterized membrane protein